MNMGPRSRHPAVENPVSMPRDMLGPVAPWAHDLGIRRGDKIRFLLYSGRGRAGPEYREATGLVHLIGPEGPVVTVGGREAMPHVVTQETFVRKIGGRRKNPIGPPPYSERGTWHHLHRLTDMLLGLTAKMSGPKRKLIDDVIGEMRDTIFAMDEQVRKGIHVNPTLGILAANPGAGGLAIEKVLSGNAYEIAYRHSEDGKNYWHEFVSGVKIGLLRDGKVLLWHPTKRLWRKQD